LGSSEPAAGSTGVGGSSGSTAPHPTPSGGASSTPAGGAPSTGTGTGVAGGVATGGSSGIAGGATGGEAGTINGAAVAACANFCSQFTQRNCPGQNNDTPSCTASCAAEVGSSDFCFQLGQAVMSCFLSIIQSSPRQCNDDVLEQKCAPELQQFEQCADSTAPAPTPAPVPIPEPAADCTSNGTSSGLTCNLTSKCNDGSYYLVNCKQSSPNESVCSCESGSGSGASAGAGFTLNESVAFACYDGISACGGPVPTLPR
jgi:hypothetical protein